MITLRTTVAMKLLGTCMTRARMSHSGLAIVSLFCAACALFPTEPPDENPKLTGTVTSVEPGNSISPSAGHRDLAKVTVLVEEEPGVWKPDLPQSAKSYFWITDQTSILVENVDGGWSKGSVDDLKVGARAAGWYGKDYLVYSSYPSKGTASHIVIFR